jgi:hypothetical protein
MWDKMFNIDLKSLKIVRVDVSRISSLSDEFKDNDRLYRGEVRKDFKFNFDKCLIILLKDKNNKGFVTIRSWNKEKERYYKSKIGRRERIVFPSSYDIVADLDFHKTQQRLI